MHKQVTFIVALIALAVGAPAQAERFGWLSSANGPDQVVVDEPVQMSTPIQSTHIGGHNQGYPFRSGCCEAKTSCCQGIWDGYCGGSCFKGGLNRHAKSCALPKGKGHSCALSGRVLGGWGGCGHGKACGVGKGGCGKGGYGKGGYGKGGMVYGKGGYSMLDKGGCGACGHKGCGGACGCGSCGHGRPGLFDWLHFGHGKGCGCTSCSGGKGHASFGKGGVKSGGGCNSCGGGVVHGWPGKMRGYPAQTHDAPIQMHSAPSVLETPTPALEAPLPPPVDVEATPTSDHSAQWRGNPYGARVMYSSF